MAGPDGEMAACMAGRGHLRASQVDLEHVIDTLKTAFVQGRLTKDELDERVGQTFASRTYAELAAVTADIPVGLAAGQPPSEPSRSRARRPVNMGVRTGVRTALGISLVAAFIWIPLAILIGNVGDSTSFSSGPDAQACRIFSSWTGPASGRDWLLNLAVTVAEQGSNRSLQDDLVTLQQAARELGDSAAQWAPGPAQELLQDQVESASISVSADCMAYNY